MGVYAYVVCEEVKVIFLEHVNACERRVCSVDINVKEHPQTLWYGDGRK